MREGGTNQAAHTRADLERLSGCGDVSIRMDFSYHIPNRDLRVAAMVYSTDRSILDRSITIPSRQLR